MTARLCIDSTAIKHQHSPDGYIQAHVQVHEREGELQHKINAREDTASLDAVWFLDVNNTPVDLCQKQSTPDRGTN